MTLAEFALRLGPYGKAVQAAVPIWRRQPPKEAAGEPLYIYEGPHGPLEVFRTGGAETEVRGGGMDPVRLPWGPDVGKDSSQRLQQGVACQVDGTAVTFSRPHYGVRRTRRVITAQVGDRTYTCRERGMLASHHIEGPDGQAVVRFDRTRHRGWMADAITRVEVVLAVLFTTSGLIAESPGVMS